MENKMFKHAPVSLPEIKAKTTNGVRLYETPEGNKYPSITTVLSVRNKQGLFEWRKRVGEDVANHIARTAAARGTKVHAMCEDYLNNVHLEWPDKWKKHEKHFLPMCLFNQLKEKGFDVKIGRLLDDIRQRDERDQTRTVAPLIPAEGALIVDSTDLSIEEVVAKILTFANGKLT